jgi:hypothetical protein
MELRQVNEKLVKRVNKFQNSVRAAQDLRNRIVHDLWLNDNLVTGNMGKLRITAARDLRFGVESITVDALQADLAKIEAQRQEAGAIRAEIEAAIPSLPVLPHHELHPIQEDRRGA